MRAADVVVALAQQQRERPGTGTGHRAPRRPAVAHAHGGPARREVGAPQRATPMTRNFVVDGMRAEASDLPGSLRRSATGWAGFD